MYDHDDVHNGTEHAWKLSGDYPVRVQATPHREPHCTDMHDMREAERTPTGKSPPRDLPGEEGGFRQLQVQCATKMRVMRPSDGVLRALLFTWGSKSAMAEIECLPGTCPCPKHKICLRCLCKSGAPKMRSKLSSHRG